MTHKQKKGFTLIEVLLVVAIIAILAGIVLVAVNPQRQTQQANNTQRESDVRTIIDAIVQYSIENAGRLPSGITTTATIIGSGAGQANICSMLVPTYVAAMPFDPTATGAAWGGSCASYNTGYTVSADVNNRVTVAAPSAQLGATISATK